MFSKDCFVMAVSSAVLVNDSAGDVKAWIAVLYWMNFVAALVKIR